MGGGRRLRWILIAAAIAVTCYFFPLFHIVRKSDVPADKIDSATEYLEQLWQRELPAAHDRTVAIDELLVALKTGSAKQFARQVGLSDTQYFFARGAGTITGLSDRKATVQIDGGDRAVCLNLGVLTGSAVRDATGLVDVNRFPRLQDYNALSGQLNQKVETEVIGPMRDKLAIGKRIQFVGCAQVRSSRDLEPLCLTPIALTIVEEAP